METHQQTRAIFPSSGFTYPNVCYQDKLSHRVCYQFSNTGSSLHAYMKGAEFGRIEKKMPASRFGYNTTHNALLAQFESTAAIMCRVCSGGTLDLTSLKGPHMTPLTHLWQAECVIQLKQPSCQLCWAHWAVRCPCPFLPGLQQT